MELLQLSLSFYLLNPNVSLPDLSFKILSQIFMSNKNYESQMFKYLTSIADDLKGFTQGK